MTRILITGSAGLLGSALCNKLALSSFEVMKFDINEHTHEPSYGNICSLNSLMEKIQCCDGIVHFAAVSRVVWGERDPEKCWQVNVEGTRNVLDAAKQSSRKPWVLFASSREVYGQQSSFPVTETATCNPMNVYARSKKAAEDLMTEYRKYDLNTAILRFSNVYGRVNDHIDRVVPAFCRAAAQGQPMRVDGFDNIFDFTHVDDVAEGVFSAIEQLNDGKLLPTMHFTSGVPTTLLELAQLANQCGDLNSEIFSAQERSFDVSRFYGEPSLAFQVLNWAPKISLANGVGELVKDFFHFYENKILETNAA